MEQKNKELLLKDLSSRLFYNPWVQFNLEYGDNGHKEGLYKAHISSIDPTSGCLEVDYFENETWEREWSGTIEQVKPYLRLMSSMTEEEKLHLRLNYGFELHGNALSNLHIIKGGGYYEREGEYVEPTEYRQYTHITIDTVSELINWLNAHHFDYMGLIEKGLALEAPEGMYN